MPDASVATTSETKAPHECPHCGKYASRPPVWLKVLDAMAGGTGRSEQAWGIPAISDEAGISRSLARAAVLKGVRDRVLEVPPEVRGQPVYRRTWYGRQLLGRWKAAGWRRAR